MRKSKFSESQIVTILKDAEGGIAVPDLLRKHGISKATFFKWRRDAPAGETHEKGLLMNADER